MKSFTLLLLTLFLGTGFAQTDCSPYVPVSIGSKWEITNYSPKAKETCKSSYELIGKEETDSGIVFTIKTISYDKKGKESLSNEFQSFCIDGKFKIDMAFRMNNGAMQTTDDMDIDMDASDFEIPTMNTNTGESLKDASLVVKASMNSIQMFNMTILITERKVEAKEEKSTPAGTFECLVLYQKISTKIMMNMVAY